MKKQRRESHISGFIKRYPFNGHSKYLIDKFYIMGYNAPTLNKLLFEENDDPNNLSKNIIIDNTDEEKYKSANLQPFHFEEDPIILNELASDFDKKCLNYDIMKEMIFPNKISLYYSEEDLSTYNKEKEKSKEKGEVDKKDDNFVIYEKNDNFNNEILKTSCVIFSSNPQAENNTKKSINGFAYIFYKKLKKKKFTAKKVYTFYIPIIFSVVSEFPFFNSYYKLCHQIKILFNLPNIDIPIEIILYNAIKFTESPINGTVLLSIKPFLLQVNKNLNNQANISNTIIEETNEDENINVKNLDDSDVLNKKVQISELYMSDNKKQNLKNYSKRNTQVITPDKILDSSKNENDKMLKTKSEKGVNLFNKIIKKKTMKTNPNEEEINLDELFPKIKFQILPGYPLIQYNLAKVLLDVMSPIHVIEIFFYTFLEKNVIFFSKNLQYLSITINSYMNLNFPLNDEKYYFINACVSLDNYINNNSPFIGATFTTILGINSAYTQKYMKSSNKMKDHLVVNLDKDEIYKIEDKEQKEKSKKNKDLFSYIKKICKKEVKSEKKQTILSREVYILYKKLNEINNLLHNSDNELENNEAFKLFKNGDYMDYDDSKNNYIKKKNIEIQDAFYRLINNLCLYFYQNLSIRTPDDDMKKYSETKTKKINKTEMNVIFREDYKDEDEKVYIDEEIFFLDEIRDTMKYESFVYCFIQSYSPIDLYKIPLTFTEEFLSIMTRKSSILENDINFFEIMDRLYGKKKVSCIVDFMPFFAQYYKEYKKDFDREIEEMNDNNLFNEELIKIKYFYDKNKKNKYLKYNDYQLDNNLLMKYMNMINNLNQEQFNNIFYMFDSINKNEAENILVINIEDIIENYSIETNLLSISDLCCSNIILLFSLSLKFLHESKDCTSFLGSLFKNFTVFRKYYSYITNMIYVLFSNFIKNNDYSRAHFYLILYYICVNSIRNLKLVPNESLMNVMKKFNEIDLKKFDEEFRSQNEKEESKGNTSSNKIEENKFDNEELTKKNLFPIYNFTKKRIIKEKEILELLTNESTIKEEGKLITPKIRFQNADLKIETLFFSQIIILNKLINVYNNFIVDLDEEHFDYELILYCCMNILVYMRNLDKFKDLDEIRDIVEIIFFLFLNKYSKKK